ncbi:MAG: peptide deformylase [Thermodesulfovibrionales bacterium]|nr:peptide deformylase [Thermodesulfovibrionales bacterium]
MALLEIKKYPEKILKEKAAYVESIDSDIQRLIDDMVETMYAARGVGLAANQVGVLKRLCVIDTSIREEERPLIVLINPVIIEKEGIEEAKEGCLSVPGYILTLKRSAKVYVKGLNREGKPIEIETRGLLSRVLQHEIDHLDGLLIIDRINPIKREFFKKRYKKSLKTATSSK